MKPKTSLDPLLTVEDLAALLQQERQTIYTKAANGVIPGRVKLGGCVRFRASIIRTWIQDSTESLGAVSRAKN